MNNVTILQTSQVLQNPKFGYNKLIIPFPEGGAPVPATESTSAVNLYTYLKAIGAVYRIAVYNGELIKMNNGSMNDYKDSSYTDQYGNTVNLYKIPTRTYSPSAVAGSQLSFKLSAGTTRVELFDFNESFAGAFFGGDNKNDKFAGDYGAIDLAQYAFLDVPRMTLLYNNSWGDIACFKGNDSIQRLQLSGTKVEGNINALIDSARNGLHTVIVAYCKNIYGELSEVLDAMRDRQDVRGTTLPTWNFWQTMVTYHGNLVNVGGDYNIKAEFDQDGNYTVYRRKGSTDVWEPLP